MFARNYHTFIMPRSAMAVLCVGLMIIGDAPVMGQVVTTRVSVASDGTEGNGHSADPSISVDGRYVAFWSRASNLVPGDTNEMWDVFVRDTKTDATTRVSVSTSGAQGNGTSRDPSISADGRYVAFWSWASNFDTSDTNEMPDVFVRDTETATTFRVSVSTSGTEGNGGSYSPSISADGRYVVFYSYASNLVDGDTNEQCDIFRSDRNTGATTRVSVSTDGAEGNGRSIAPIISPDGRYVAFESEASNLVMGDTNEMPDVFVRDTEKATTLRVSESASGTEGNGNSDSPSISADGRYVAFASWASNLVPGDIIDSSDVFVRDTKTGATTRVSVSTSGAQGYGSSVPSISAYGRYVAFESAATNLVSGDTNESSDVFVRDTKTRTTTRVSVSNSGAQGNQLSGSPSINADGRYVAFSSFASNLVAGDTNGKFDIFLRRYVIFGPSFLQQPDWAYAGQAFDPIVKVLSNTPVTLAIKPGTGASGAILNGTLTVTPVNGVATYTDLEIDKAGPNYVLVASNADPESAFSQPFDVYTLPSLFVFATQPGGAVKSTPFTVQPVLLARDASNTLISDYTGPVTLAIKAGTGTPGAVLSGTTTVYAVGGVAAFTDLSIDRKGTGYVLEASVGGTVLGESAPFNVTPKAERLAFTGQPGLATDDWPFGAQPVVTVQDADGETATLYGGSVSVAIKPGTGAEAAALTGITTVGAPTGVATFTGLGIPKLGIGYVLTASAPGLTSAESAAFDVVEAPKLVPSQSGPNTLEITLRPAGQTIAGATITLSWDANDLEPVTIADVTPFGNWTLDSLDANSGLTLSLSNWDGVSENGPVAMVRLTAKAGVAGRAIPVTLTGDSYLTDTVYNNIPVLARTLAFIPGRHLAFTQQPVLTTAGEAIAGQPTVSLLDGTGAVVTDYAEPVTMAIKPGTGTEGAVLGGTLTKAPVSGTAVFTDLTIDRKGSGYVLTAVSGDVNAESLPFDIAPRALMLAFTTQPGTTRAGLPLTPHPTVTVQDEEGETAFAYSGLITLAIKPGTGYPGATLGGSPTLNAVSGVATFNNVSINSASPGYVLLASGQSLTGAQSDSFDVTAFTFNAPDIVTALRWAAGLSQMPAGYLNRFDVAPNGSITIADAARISRKVVGLEGNP